jgi:transposase
VTAVFAGPTRTLIRVAGIDSFGRELGDREFPQPQPATARPWAPCNRSAQWRFLGIEGTSSYGAGLTVAGRAAGMTVRKVIRPEASVRRMQGKSDPIDAYQAARAAMTGRAKDRPKDEDIEGLRALLNPRRSAAEARPRR